MWRCSRPMTGDVSSDRSSASGFHRCSRSPVPRPLPNSLSRYSQDFPEIQERRRGSFPNSLPRRRRLCPPRRTEARHGRYVRHLERGVTYSFFGGERVVARQEGWSHGATTLAWVPLAGQGAAVKTDRPKLCEALRRGYRTTPRHVTDGTFWFRFPEGLPYLQLCYTAMPVPLRTIFRYTG